MDMNILEAQDIVREFRKTLADDDKLGIALDNVCMAVDSVGDMLTVCMFNRDEFNRE